MITGFTFFMASGSVVPLEVEKFNHSTAIADAPIIIIASKLEIYAGTKSREVYSLGFFESHAHTQKTP